MRNRKVAENGPYRSNCVNCTDIFSHMEPIKRDFICIDCAEKPAPKRMFYDQITTEDFETKENQIPVLSIYRRVCQATGQDTCEYIVLIADSRIFYTNEFAQCDIYGDGEKIVQILIKKDNT